METDTETEQKQRIAIQGIAGCFHEVAARNWLQTRCGEVETVECDTFPELFERVVADHSLLGIVAIENTIAGSLLPNHELLRRSGLQVLGEEKLRISHVLCALPGETIETVKEVNSHPMALMQCEEFLRSYKHFNVVEKTDTAGSALDIAHEQLHGRAAVCAALAAQLYGLDILAEGIETNKRNFTRFLIVGHRGVGEQACNRVDWPMTLFVPMEADAIARLLSNASVTVVKYNALGLEGSPAVTHRAFDRRRGMPRPRNVLIPSIMIGAWLGYKTILLAGADHSWTANLSVAPDNRVITNLPHFYTEDAREQERIKAVYADIPLHALFLSYHIAFKAYHEIARWASSRGITILNATPGSFIDAFPRTTL